MSEARSFGAAAAQYERGRPSYPDEAIDWLLPPGARRVLDLGAGTGKLSRRLRARGVQVVGVEPSARMREQFTLAVPDVEVLDGTAERIPLDEHSVDVVLVAQAWHWVDPARAVPEVARVLVPGGQLGLLWNVRDDRMDWVARLYAILQRDGRRPDRGTPTVGPPFGPLEKLAVEWTYHLAPDLLVDMVSSWSYVIVAPAEQRAQRLAGVRRLLATHPALAGAERIGLPYVTECFRTRLA